MRETVRIVSDGVVTRVYAGSSELSVSRVEFVYDAMEGPRALIEPWRPQLEVETSVNIRTACPCCGHPYEEDEEAG